LILKYKDFDVIETGWCKLDKLFRVTEDTLKLKQELLYKSRAKHIILYAPTFSPSLTSATYLKDTVAKLSTDRDNLIIVKFHDKMDKETIALYKMLQTENFHIIESNDITPFLQIADIMISDTSSVVYEFLLLNKPVVTLNSRSEHINWPDFTDADEVYGTVIDVLRGIDSHADQRAEIIALYHPYHDGKSSVRTIEAANRCIVEHGVPERRRLPLHRKLKMLKAYKGK
jgi:CDP-glycerol glycerophosphotransferase (TagB/SpsB family)